MGSSDTKLWSAPFCCRQVEMGHRGTLMLTGHLCLQGTTWGCSRPVSNGVVEEEEVVDTQR